MLITAAATKMRLVARSMRKQTLNDVHPPLQLVCRSAPSFFGNHEPHPRVPALMDCALYNAAQLFVTSRLCRILERRHERRYCISRALQWSDRCLTWHFRSCQPCFAGSDECHVISAAQLYLARLARGDGSHLQWKSRSFSRLAIIITIVNVKYHHDYHHQPRHPQSP